MEKEKRYYSVGEIVWVVPHKMKGQVLEIDTSCQNARISLETELVIGDASIRVISLKLWEIDKLRQTDTGHVDFSKPLPMSVSNPTLYFSRLREEAVVPQKRSEDLGYDLFASLTEEHITADGHRELFIPRLTAGFIPTGLAMAVSENWGISLQHERGSVGSKGIVITAGAGDSGYRDEYFICALPVQYNLLLTTDASEVEFAGTEDDPTLIYPVSKAIAQAIIIPNPISVVKELDYEILKNIPSSRGMGKLGSTN